MLWVNSWLYLFNVAQEIPVTKIGQLMFDEEWLDTQGRNSKYLLHQ